MSGYPDATQPYERVPAPAPHDNETDAYPPANSSWRKRLWLIFGCLLSLVILRNIIFNNYDDDTKSYLRSVGRSDLIDNLYPKTADEFLKDKKRQEQTIQDLVANVTALQEQYKYLSGQVQALQTQIAVTPQPPSLH